MSVKYNFEIHTGDEIYAGTDSNIFVQLIGERGITNEVRLNGYISGNAFERNQTDRFSATFNHDVGNIYQILLRSDHRYAGADWLLDYIKVRFVRSTSKKVYRDFTTFQVAEWINDTKSRTYNVTAGYEANPKIKTRIWLKEDGAPHSNTNPTKTPMEWEVVVDEKWAVEFHLDTKHMTSISVKASVSGEYKWVKAAVEVGVQDRIESESGYKWSQEMSFGQKFNYTVDPGTTLELLETWAVATLPVDVNLGDTAIAGSGQKDERRFAGFRDPTTGEWLLRVDHVACLIEPQSQAA